MTNPVIDFRVRLPSDLRPAVSDPSPDLYVQYEEILHVSEARTKTLRDLVAEMDDAGVDLAVVHAEYEHGDGVDEMNEAVGKLVVDDSDRFLGVGTVSFSDYRVMRAVRQVGRIASLRLLGVNLQPVFFGFNNDDRRLYPVYAKAAESGLMVALHTGINYSRVHSMKAGTPARIDRIASDFPDLTIIACHAGWPWATEMAAVARKHPNVLLEFGALAPRYVGRPGTGWEVVYHFMDRLLTEQVLFASDWPVIPMKRALGEWRELGLKPGTLDGLLGRNAARLLGLGTEAAY